MTRSNSNIFNEGNNIVIMRNEVIAEMMKWSSWLEENKLYLDINKTHHRLFKGKMARITMYLFIRFYQQDYNVNEHQPTIRHTAQRYNVVSYRREGASVAMATILGTFHRDVTANGDVIKKIVGWIQWDKVQKEVTNPQYNTRWQIK